MSDDTNASTPFWKRWSRANAPLTPDVTDATLAQADALYEQAVLLGQSPKGYQGAEQAAAAAVTIYRSLCQSSDATTARHKLARALWRQSMYMLVNGKAGDAMQPGREAVALMQEVVAASTENTPEFDGVVGEFGTMMNDLSQIALAAGRSDEAYGLMRDVSDVCQRSRGKAALQARGTALHNLASAMLDTTFERVESGQAPVTDLLPVLKTASEAATVRQNLLDPDLPLTSWELANSLSLIGYVLCLVGQGQAGVQALTDAYRHLSLVSGAAADSLRQRIMTTLEMARNMYPEQNNLS